MHREDEIKLEPVRGHDTVHILISGRYHIGSCFLQLQHLVAIQHLHYIRRHLSHHGYRCKVSLKNISISNKIVEDDVKGRRHQSFVSSFSFEVAKDISEDSYGLIFGVNTFIALLAQSLLTFIVVNELMLDIRQQVRKKRGGDKRRKRFLE